MVKLYDDALRYGYMITEKALKKAKILAFWEKHGLEATKEAFEVKRRTLFAWKKQWKEGGKTIESLNDKSRAPQRKRKRLWDQEITSEIKRLRFDHPNLGKDKLFPELLVFAGTKHLKCPQPKTIGRLIKDLGGLRMAPTKVSHFGKVKPLIRKKVLRKPKDFTSEYPGHCVALDTIEKHIWGRRYYVISFEDTYTRFGFAWETNLPCLFSRQGIL